MAAIPCRRRRRATPRCSRSATSSTHRPGAGWPRLRQRAPLSATTPGCTRPRRVSASAALPRVGRSILSTPRRRLAPGLDRHLGNAVTIEPPARLGPALDELARAGERVQVDPGTAASWIFDRLTQAGGRIHRAADPCLLPKACKNPVELDGTPAAPPPDGPAGTRF